MIKSIATDAENEIVHHPIKKLGLKVSQKIAIRKLIWWWCILNNIHFYYNLLQI